MRCSFCCRGPCEPALPLRGQMKTRFIVALGFAGKRKSPTGLFQRQAISKFRREPSGETTRNGTRLAASSQSRRLCAHNPSCAQPRCRRKRELPGSVVAVAAVASHRAGEHRDEQAPYREAEEQPQHNGDGEADEGELHRIAFHLRHLVNVHKPGDHDAGDADEKAHDEPSELHAAGQLHERRRRVNGLRLRRVHRRLLRLLRFRLSRLRELLRLILRELLRRGRLARRRLRLADGLRRLLRRALVVSLLFGHDEPTFRSVKLLFLPPV